MEREAKEAKKKQYFEAEYEEEEIERVDAGEPRRQELAQRGRIGLLAKEHRVIVVDHETAQHEEQRHPVDADESGNRME